MSTPSRTRCFPLLIALTALGFSACGPALFPMPDDPVADPEVLLDAVRSRAEHLGPMAVEARIAGRTDRGRVRGRVSILADAANSRLRIDAWTPTDDLIAALVAGPDGLAYFERGAGGCLVGPACRENLQLLLPLGLGLTDAVRALYGIPPGIDHAGPWAIGFDRRVGAYRLTAAAAPEVETRLWIRDDGAVVRAERVTEGKRDLWMAFADLDRAGLPRRLEFKSLADGSEVSVRYREVDRDPDLVPEDWEPACPRGLPTRVLPCEGGP